MHSDIRYDRRVSPEFLEHFKPTGAASSLARFASAGLFPLDLQFRRDPKSAAASFAQHATLYAGLTAVLNVVSTKTGFRLKAHSRWASKTNGFLDAWGEPATADEWREQWTDVEKYLERVIPLAVKSHGLTEGAVQSAVSGHKNTERVMLDREVAPSFRDQKVKTTALSECRAPIIEALANSDLALGKVPSFGAECDLLSLDAQGRLLAVEVKPYNGAGITWVPAQAAMYARVLQRWVDHDQTPGDGAREVIEGMLAQRQTLGFGAGFVSRLPRKMTVIPVVALQRGASDKALERLQQVRRVVDAARLAPPIEVFEVSLTGELLPLKPNP